MIVQINNIDKAFINDIKLILTDKPAGNLDEKTSLGVMELLNDIHKSRRTILMASEDYQFREEA